MKNFWPFIRQGMSLTALLIICLATTPISVAFAESLGFGGSIKSLDLYSKAAPADLLPESKVSSNRLRLGSWWEPNPAWRIDAALDHQLLWTNPGEVVPLPQEGINRHFDLDRTWQHSDIWASRLQVDRLNLRWQGDRVDMVLGRQAIGYGRIVIFSPLDIIAPFAPYAIDTDVRPGVDAMRATVHYGLDGQLGGILVLGDEERHNSYLAIWSDNRAGIDLLAISGELRSRPMIGVGMAGSIGTLGLKGEITLYEGQRTSQPDGDLHDSYAIGALEAWYRFDNGITLITEYLYNGPGVGDPADYPAVAASAPLQEGMTYLLGRHYLMATPSYEVHPLVTLRGLLIWNLEDDSSLIRPSVTCDLTDNIVLELFWTRNNGEDPQQVSAWLPPVPESEFGLRGDSGGFFLKYFF